ncbi:MAG TPA: hypothetical protein VK364_13705, partial [Hymenobacter sp.]|nr:hypothetical protein [Hymenobacter sp.]
MSKNMAAIIHLTHPPARHQRQPRPKPRQRQPRIPIPPNQQPKAASLSRTASNHQNTQTNH